MKTDVNLLFFKPNVKVNMLLDAQGTVVKTDALTDILNKDEFVKTEEFSKIINLLKKLQEKNIKGFELAKISGGWQANVNGRINVLYGLGKDFQISFILDENGNVIRSNRPWYVSWYEGLFGKVVDEGTIDSTTVSPNDFNQEDVSFLKELPNIVKQATDLKLKYLLIEKIEDSKDYPTAEYNLTIKRGLNWVLFEKIAEINILLDGNKKPLMLDKSYYDLTYKSFLESSEFSNILDFVEITKQKNIKGFELTKLQVGWQANVKGRINVLFGLGKDFEISFTLDENGDIVKSDSPWYINWYEKLFGSTVH
jgi:hypothetical protein